jgi:hypothetical protein
MVERKLSRASTEASSDFSEPDFDDDILVERKGALQEVRLGVARAAGLLAKYGLKR